jgi:hypothetical protein
VYKGGTEAGGNGRAYGKNFGVYGGKHSAWRNLYPFASFWLGLVRERTVALADMAYNESRDLRAAVMLLHCKCFTWSVHTPRLSNTRLPIVKGIRGVK